MSPHLRKRLDEYLHDIVLVGLPLMICAVAGCILYAYSLIKLEKMHIFPASQASYESRLLWTIIAVSAILSLLFGGRLTAFVWKGEENLGFNPPPCRIYRKFGMVFCWSDNLTSILVMIGRFIATPGRLIARLSRHAVRPYRRSAVFMTACAAALDRSIRGLFLRLSRRRRRLRIRLLWLARTAAAMPEAPAAHVHQAPQPHPPEYHDSETAVTYALMLRAQAMMQETLVLRALLVSQMG